MSTSLVYLDRYKNPKKKGTKDNNKGKVQTLSSLRKIQQNQRTFIETSRVNSNDFLTQDESQVPEDKVNFSHLNDCKAFFYKYFSQREKMGLNKKAENEGNESEEIDIIPDERSDEELPEEFDDNNSNIESENSSEEVQSVFALIIIGIQFRRFHGLRGV